MRILCIKLEINQGYTTMHGQSIIKIFWYIAFTTAFTRHKVQYVPDDREMYGVAATTYKKQYSFQSASFQGSFAEQFVFALQSCYAG